MASTDPPREPIACPVARAVAFQTAEGAGVERQRGRGSGGGWLLLPAVDGEFVFLLREPHVHAVVVLSKRQVQDHERCRDEAAAGALLWARLCVVCFARGQLGCLVALRPPSHTQPWRGGELGSERIASATQSVSQTQLEAPAATEHSRTCEMPPPSCWLRLASACMY
jgi:hypothetical protein